MVKSVGVFSSVGSVVFPTGQCDPCSGVVCSASALLGIVSVDEVLGGNKDVPTSYPELIGVTPTLGLVEGRS